MAFKFEKLGVWQLAIAYTDAAYTIAEQLPPNERFGLRDQLTRAANSIALNVAEGSTGQSDEEQSRFLGYALRSLVETVACLHLIRRRGYLADPAPLRATYREAEELFAKLQAFRRTLRQTKPPGMREDDAPYDSDSPFQMRTLIGVPRSAVGGRVRGAPGIRYAETLLPSPPVQPLQSCPQAMCAVYKLA